MITPIGQAKKKWVFEDILGGKVELDLDGTYDVECMCCQLYRMNRLPMRCHPKVIESSSGRDRGEIIGI